MVRKNYKLKKTISVKQFIQEFGENFSQHTKDRLMELEIRCVLTRKDDPNRLDLKHVEHTKYKCAENEDSKQTEKEYAFAQFIVSDGIVYFSEKCRETNDVMQNEIVDKIYNSLSSEGIITYEDVNAKKIDESNIDFVIDSILSACPDVSQRYISIVKDMLSRSNNKF
ncbi:hypothetical protein [Clostridium sp. JN-9]|uniref:hypothetical protein n=1 Tax=Clostridium sp. JN-9 TaxID=2507159 RepID=UPI000FFE0972|nr:hypothetical protein [Clostridium sp. JN-9]QAT39126.1 hypothetical protein EQM05_01975 [Clostridium sp. JN-9]